jgi:predicted CXXCH cytochrome family protein
MNKQSGILCTCVLALTLLLGGYSLAATPAPAPTTAPAKPSAAKPAKAVTKPSAAAAKQATPATAAPKAAAVSKDACLMCHGSYEKIMAVTANYKMMSGEKEITSNPHRYVPHESKDIPECSYCHEPHPVPLAKKEGLPKPKATWCYGCHHTKDLTCGTCH